MQYSTKYSTSKCTYTPLKYGIFVLYVIVFLKTLTSKYFLKLLILHFDCVHSVRKCEGAAPSLSVGGANTCLPAVSLAFSRAHTHTPSLIHFSSPFHGRISYKALNTPQSLLLPKLLTTFVLCAHEYQTPL